MLFFCARLKKIIELIELKQNRFIIVIHTDITIIFQYEIRIDYIGQKRTKKKKNENSILAQVNSRLNAVVIVFFFSI